MNTLVQAVSGGDDATNAGNAQDAQAWSSRFRAGGAAQHWARVGSGTGARAPSAPQCAAREPSKDVVMPRDSLLAAQSLSTPSSLAAGRQQAWPSLHTKPFVHQAHVLEYEHAGVLQRYAAEGPCTPMLLPCGHHCARHAVDELAANAALSGADTPACPVCAELFCSEDVVVHAILRSLVQQAAGEMQPACTAEGYSAVTQALARDAMLWQQSATLLDGALAAPFRRADGITVHHLQLDGQQCVVKCFSNVDVAERAAAALWQLLVMTALQDASGAERPAAAPMVFWSVRGTTVCVVTHSYPVTLMDVVREHTASASGGLDVERAVELAFQLTEALVAAHTCAVRGPGGVNGFRGVVHGLIHPDNVLVPHDGSHVALCSFGNSALLTGDALMRPAHLASQMVDDSEWSACEVVCAAQEDAAAEAINDKVDVWGVANVLLYLATGVCHLSTSEAIANGESG